LLLRPEDGGQGRREESSHEVGVLDGAAVEWMANAVQAAREELCLFADAVRNRSCELARQRQVASHASGKLLGRIHGIVDVPFELVNQGMRADGDIQLDQYPHLVVLVGRVGELGVEGVFLGVSIGVEVVELFVYLLHNQLVDLLVDRRVEAHVLHHLGSK
jgi:hypothetical protein